MITMQTTITDEQLVLYIILLYIILLYNFNSLMWLKGLVEVDSLCSRDDMLDNFQSMNNNDIVLLFACFQMESQINKYK